MAPFDVSVFRLWPGSVAPSPGSSLQIAIAPSSVTYCNGCRIAAEGHRTDVSDRDP